MKKKYFGIVLLMLLFSFNTSQAQLWKKIQEAAQKKVEDKANQKIQNKTDEAVEEGFEQVEASLSGFGMNKVEKSAVPNTYDFSWKYVMEVKTEEGKAMNIDYMLKPDASYFGFNINQGKEQTMLMIMDIKNNLILTCFGDGKNKMATASQLPDYSEIAKNEESQSDYVFKTLPNKTFLGYNCKGIQATNDEYDIVFYFTNEAPVSFGELYRSQKAQKMPKVIADYFKPGDKNLMMDMSMKDLKKKSKMTTMKCISLEKNNYTFKKADYKFM